MGHLGIEPRTYQLKAEYSTVELVALHKTNYKELSSFYAKITNFHECIKWWTKEEAIIKMNFNVISQLLTIFIIVSMGPAVIAYLSYKKAL